MQMSSTATSKPKKIAPLESLRGIAALIVFFGHFVLGFLPQYHGQAPAGIPGKQLQESPLFFFVNGSGWVTFFFVLSGFVLSYRFYTQRTNDRLAAAVIKRWPRLFPLALISTVFSYLMIEYGLYSYFQASQITQSDWMARLAWGSKGGVFEVTFWEAFTQGMLTTFFRGDDFLNSSLWTMHYEFIGSLLVFGMIPILNQQKLLSGFLIYLIAIAAIVLSPISKGFVPLFMIAFVSGCFFSFYIAQHHTSQNNQQPNLVLFILGLTFAFLALGFLSPAKGFYSFLNLIPAQYLRLFQICAHTLASIILIYYALNHAALYRILDGRFGRFLGRISFALYVIHVPIIFSLSTAVFLKFMPIFGYSGSVALAFLVTLPILFLVSWLMSLFDEVWCKKVNQAVRKL